ncbi:MAG: S8 family serine peptidase [Thermomicrobiales bacterium]
MRGGTGRGRVYTIERCGGFVVVMALLASLIAVIVGAPSVVAQDTGDIPAGGPVVVVLNDQASFRGASVTDQLDVEPTQVYDTIFNGFAADLDGEQILELSQNPQVAAIVPDVTFYGDADYPPAIARAGLTDAVSGGTSGASIAIIDSGIASHGALNIAGGYNCMSTDRGAWGDNAGHGTHVAGIAGASGGSSIGSAPGASLWAVKVLDGSAGSNPTGSLSTVLCGLNWVAANAGMFDAANMSLTTSGSGATACSDASDPLHGAICAVVNAGVPVVVAAGNSSTTGGVIPAAYPEVISVASLTDYNGMPGGGAPKPGYCPGTNDGPDDTISGFSNYGALADLAAPGACIISTYIGGGYAYLSGTSMASPLVAGVVANYVAGGGGDPLGWLLSSATMAESSAAGYSGSKSAGPVLYLSGTVITPTPSGTVTATVTATGTAMPLSPLPRRPSSPPLPRPPRHQRPPQP